MDTGIFFWLTGIFMISSLMVRFVPDLWYSTQGRGEVSVQSLTDCALRDYSTVSTNLKTVRRKELWSHV